MLVCPLGAKGLASKQRLPYACLFKEASIDKRKQGKQALARDRSKTFYLGAANLRFCFYLAFYLLLASLHLFKHQRCLLRCKLSMLASLNKQA
jgi:hypothetical protein